MLWTGPEEEGHDVLIPSVAEAGVATAPAAGAAAGGSEGGSLNLETIPGNPM